MNRRLIHVVHALDHALGSPDVMNPTIPNPTEILALNLPAHRIDRPTSRTEKGSICIKPKAAPTRENLTVHHAVIVLIL